MNPQHNNGTKKCFENEATNLVAQWLNSSEINLVSITKYHKVAIRSISSQFSMYRHYKE